MAYSDGERRCANIISNPALPFRNLVDLRIGGVHILLIFTSFTNALPWITNSSLLWKEQEFYHKDIHIVVPEKESSLCCFAASMLGNQAIPIALLHSSCPLSAVTWFCLKPFESVGLCCRQKMRTQRESSLWYICRVNARQPSPYTVLASCPLLYEAG